MSVRLSPGEAWAVLRAVHVNGTIEVVDDEAETARIQGALDEKYSAFRTASSAMPDATRAHYSGRTFFRLVPDGRILSSDNRRIPLDQKRDEKR